MTTTNPTAGAAGRWATGTGEVGSTTPACAEATLGSSASRGVRLLRAGAGGSLSSQFDHDPLPVLAAPGPATTKKTFTTKGDLMTATILQPPHHPRRGRGDR